MLEDLEEWHWISKIYECLLDEIMQNYNNEMVLINRH